MLFLGIKSWPARISLFHSHLLPKKPHVGVSPTRSRGKLFTKITVMISVMLTLKRLKRHISTSSWGCSQAIIAIFAARVFRALTGRFRRHVIFRAGQIISPFATANFRCPPSPLVPRPPTHTCALAPQLLSQLLRQRSRHVPLGYIYISNPGLTIL